MSNDLIMSIKKNLSVVKGVDDDTRAVAGSVGGGKRISIKGSVFRKMVGGKQVSTVEGRKMNVIFVKMAHAASRTYYEKSYKEGDKVSPICWSTDGRAPDSDVKNPQATECKSCNYSVKGSGQGGTGSGCRLQWRTAVVLPHDPAGDVMQLVLPATSCFGEENSGRWPFRPYVQMLARNDVSAGHVITEMQFDLDSPVPKLYFSPVAAITEEDIDIVKKQAVSPAAMNAVKLTVFQQAEESCVVQPSAIGDAPIAGMTTQEAAAVEPEPQLRASKKSSPVEGNDLPDVIKKWSKK